jgi:hypothetical protein
MGARRDAVKYLVVTTYAQRHWESHALRCVETFRKHWGDIPLVQYRDQDLERASPWLAEFKARHWNRPTADYRMDAVRFAHKVAAIECAEALARTEMPFADVLIWMDADCVTHADVTPQWLDSLLRDGDFGYLKRTMKYPECGFMMFRLNARGREFIASIVREYTTDDLFKLPEWHDSYVIDQVRAARERIGMLRCVSLSGNAERTHHPLINGPLGAKLDHLKGPRKQLGKSRAGDLKVIRSESYWSDLQPAKPTTAAARSAARRRLTRRAP